MTASPDDAKAIANTSGFLFQLAVEAAIRRLAARGSTNILAREYPWRDAEARGFIDLLVRKDSATFVIECKRSRDATWVFPIEMERSIRTLDVTCRFVERPDRSETIHSDHGTLGAEPESLAAEFCAVRGQGEGDRSMLERICDSLLLATDAYCAETLAMLPPRVGSLQWFVPLIVTNAALKAWIVKPGEISLETGTLDSGNVLDVPYVRFHKAMSHNISATADLRTIADLVGDRIRTVIIVNATQLPAFVEAWTIRRQ